MYLHLTRRAFSLGGLAACLPLARIAQRFRTGSPSPQCIEWEGCDAAIEAEAEAHTEDEESTWAAIQRRGRRTFSVSVGCYEQSKHSRIGLTLEEVIAEEVEGMELVPHRSEDLVIYEKDLLRAVIRQGPDGRARVIVFDDAPLIADPPLVRFRDAGGRG